MASKAAFTGASAAISGVQRHVITPTHRAFTWNSIAANADFAESPEVGPISVLRQPNRIAIEQFPDGGLE